MTTAVMVVAVLVATGVVLWALHELHMQGAAIIALLTDLRDEAKADTERQRKRLELFGSKEGREMLRQRLRERLKV